MASQCPIRVLLGSWVMWVLCLGDSHIALAQASDRAVCEVELAATKLSQASDRALRLKVEEERDDAIAAGRRCVPTPDVVGSGKLVRSIEQLEDVLARLETALSRRADGK